MALGNQKNNKEDNNSPGNSFNEIIKWPCTLARTAGFWPYNMDRKDGTWKNSMNVPTMAMNLVLILGASTSLAGLHRFGFLLFGHLESSRAYNGMESVGRLATSLLTYVGLIIITITMMAHKEGIASNWNHLNTVSNQILAELEVEVESKSLNESGRQMLRNRCNRLISRKKLFAKLITACTGAETMLVLIIVPVNVIWGMIQANGVTKETIYAGFAYFHWSSVTRIHVSLIPLLTVMLGGIGMLFTILAAQVKAVVKVLESHAFQANHMTTLAFFTDTKIRSVFQSAEELECIVSGFNFKFGTQMFVTMSIIGVNLIFNAFSIVVNWAAYSQTFGYHSMDILSFCFDLILFSLICSSASSLTQSAQHFGDQVGKLTSLNVWTEGVASRAQYVACKFNLRPPTFSPGYYFNVNNQLLTSLVTMVATYLTVLLQFSGFGNVANGQTKHILANNSTNGTINH